MLWLGVTLPASDLSERGDRSSGRLDLLGAHVEALERGGWWWAECDLRDEARDGARDGRGGTEMGVRLLAAELEARLPDWDL